MVSTSTTCDPLDNVVSTRKSLAASKRYVIFAGGGTGGHLFPGISVAKPLMAQWPEARIVFAGTAKPLECRLVAQAGFIHWPMTTVSPSHFWKRPWSVIWGNLLAVCHSLFQMIRDRPQCVVGLGGYSSVPLLFAAILLRIPVVLLEQNVLPGKATRAFSGWANIICVTYPESSKYLSPRAKCVVTGNPVRDEFLSLRSKRESHGEPHSPQLTILGGSLGADSLNRAMTTSIANCRSALTGWKIVHQTGERLASQIRDEYVRTGTNAIVVPFFDDLPSVLADTTLVVCRAGGTTLSELAAAGIPAILVPFPTASENHQGLNAAWFVERGAARMIQENLGTEPLNERLAAEIQQCAIHLEIRKAMSQKMRDLSSPEAAARICGVITSLIGVY